MIFFCIIGDMSSNGEDFLFLYGRIFMKLKFKTNINQNHKLKKS